MIDVGVDVDEAGRDDAAVDVAHRWRPGLNRGRYRGDLAGPDGDVEPTINAVALIDDAAALEDEVVARADLQISTSASPGILRTRSVLQARRGPLWRLLVRRVRRLALR